VILSQMVVFRDSWELPECDTAAIIAHMQRPYVFDCFASFRLLFTSTILLLCGVSVSLSLQVPYLLVPIVFKLIFKLLTLRYLTGLPSAYRYFLPY
jgi:hypothetical protein